MRAMSKEGFVIGGAALTFAYVVAKRHLDYKKNPRLYDPMGIPEVTFYALLAGSVGGIMGSFAHGLIEGDEVASPQALGASNEDVIAELRRRLALNPDDSSAREALERAEMRRLIMPEAVLASMQDVATRIGLGPVETERIRFKFDSDVPWSMKEEPFSQDPLSPLAWVVHLHRYFGNYEALVVWRDENGWKAGVLDAKRSEPDPGYVGLRPEHWFWWREGPSPIDKSNARKVLYDMASEYPSTEEREPHLW